MKFKLGDKLSVIGETTRGIICYISAVSEKNYEVTYTEDAFEAGDIREHSHADIENVLHIAQDPNEILKEILCNFV